MKRLPHIIKGNEFAVLAAIASMVLQSKHTYMAFLSAESLDPNFVDIIFAVLAAVVIDLSILFYTLRNKHKIALGAMLSMVVINSYGYWIIHHTFNIQFAMGMFFSIIIPISVFYYSEEIVITRSKKVL